MRILGLAAMLGAAAVMAAGCASMPAPGEARAPEPAKPIEMARFYTGRWYEIARTPMKLTDGCVAGTTDYQPKPSILIDRDACRAGGPTGKEKVFAGPVTILDPGRNTKVRVDYQVFGLLTVPRTYWMLDHGDDYAWFIVSTPDLKNMNIFTRDPRPSPELVTQLTARVRELGYDPAKLEFPAQLPPGVS